jgi:hypothetical protein
VNSKDFVDIFSPFRGKYVKKVPIDYTGDLFNPENLEWRLYKTPLQLFLIQRALEGREIIACFQRTYTNVLGLDIDDHTGTAWTGGIASYYLLDTYHSVIERLGFWPNILVQSPRGLHCYFIFDEKVPIKILEELAAPRLYDLVQKNRVEILPTTKKALRIPQNTLFLDPHTLASIEPPSKDNIKEIPVGGLFDKSLKTVISKQTKKKQRQLFKSLTKFEIFENRCAPLINNNTNDEVVILWCVYRDGELPLDQAVERFMRGVVDKSALYEGELNNPHRVKQRIASIYRNKKIKKEIIPRCDNLQYQLFDDVRIDQLMERDFPFSNQRIQPVRYFLQRLFWWAEWHDQIKNDCVLITYFDYMYPWYRKNRKEGLYPLPSNCLKKWNSHYTSIIDWLIKIGFLEPAPYKYSPDAGICQYYRIHWTLIDPSSL